MIKCTTSSYGTKIWRNSKGQVHRTRGPAVEFSSSYKAWYQRDKFHRLDGPAEEWNNGIKIWYYQGLEINCASQQEFERKVRLLAFL